MKFNIGFTADASLKRLLDVIPNGKRSEVIRKAIWAYAPEINSMKEELERIHRENLEIFRALQERENRRKNRLRKHYESMAKHEVMCWLESLNQSVIDLSS